MKAELNNLRVGLFGGTFNPLHLGHVNALTTVRQRLNLDKIMVVPAAQNPLKQPVEGPTDQQRLEMLQIGLTEFSDFVAIDEQELQRGGMSYAVDTVQSYAEFVPPENLYVIIGMDAFEEFDKWKDFSKILGLANLAVVTRPGYMLPFSQNDLPAGVQPLVGAFDRQFIALNTGRNIEFVQLKDADIAASDVRKRLRTGRSVERFLSIEIEDYIRNHSLYGPLGPRVGDVEVFTRFCAEFLTAKKAINVKGYHLKNPESIVDFTLVASGTSTRHASSLADNLVQAVKDEYGVLPQSVEGMSEGRWVLLDYGDVIVHLFYDFVRQEYRIEELWRTAVPLALPEKTGVAQKS